MTDKKKSTSFVHDLSDLGDIMENRKIDKDRLDELHDDWQVFLKRLVGNAQRALAIACAGSLTLVVTFVGLSGLTTLWALAITILATANALCVILYIFEVDKAKHTFHGLGHAINDDIAATKRSGSRAKWYKWVSECTANAIPVVLFFGGLVAVVAVWQSLDTQDHASITPVSQSTRDCDAENEVTRGMGA